MQLNPGQPPWHMWGVSEIVEIRADPSGPFTVSTPQLARIAYRRPESWRFLLWAQIVSAAPAVSFADFTVLRADFLVTAGNGRSVFSNPPTRFGAAPAFEQQPFARLMWFRGAGASMLDGPQKWTTKGMGPQMNEGATVPLFPETEVLVADNINCIASLILTVPLGAPPMTLRVEVGAAFAPATHVRPDWFRNASDPVAFLGNECGGS